MPAIPLPDVPPVLPNLPIMPTIDTIRQMVAIDTINLAESFFISSSTRSVEQLKYLLCILSTIFAQRVREVQRIEAYDAYLALEITAPQLMLDDPTTATQAQLVIAIADYYVCASASLAVSAGVAAVTGAGEDIG